MLEEFEGNIMPFFFFAGGALLTALVRRYLALQLAPHHDRRSKDKASHKEAPLSVVGFFMTELEVRPLLLPSLFTLELTPAPQFSTGALFLCCAAPWSTTGQVRLSPSPSFPTP